MGRILMKSEPFYSILAPSVADFSSCIMMFSGDGAIWRGKYPLYPQLNHIHHV